MESSDMKNMLVIKNLPSNMVEEAIIIFKENQKVREKELIENIKSVLTDFEQQVFELKLSSFTYKEIAEILERDIKSIDNALQRIKIKIKEQLNK